MSLYEFLERLDADPFDHALTDLFLCQESESRQESAADHATK